MILLTLAGSLNDDKCLVSEDAIEWVAMDSSSPNPRTIISFSSGTSIAVKETVEEVRDAIAAIKDR